MMEAQKSSPIGWRCRQVHSHVHWSILKLATTRLDPAASFSWDVRCHFTSVGCGRAGSIVLSLLQREGGRRLVP